MSAPAPLFAADVARALASLTVLEMELRGRDPANHCRAAREALARVWAQPSLRHRLPSELARAELAIRTRGGCYYCGVDVLCTYCAAGRDAVAL